MYRKILRFAAALAGVASFASATSFVVPDDDELLAKSHGVLIGVVEGSYARELAGEIETVYEIRAERGLEGGFHAGDLVPVVTLGGFIGGRGVVVNGAARFDNGERVLLFLTFDGGAWRPTDLTLGKFRFVTSTTGRHLLTRDLEDTVGWERNGKVHHEPLRDEEQFLRFLENRLGGRKAAADYFVSPASVTLAPSSEQIGGGIQAGATAFPPRTYTTNVSDGTTFRGTRWPNISAGVTFQKRVDQNASGLTDGGVSVIQNGMAAWNNECGSNINLIYGGTTSTASANFDSVHVVEFNDPQGRIPGSWTGSGTIAITFISYAGQHSFAGDTWWTITDADVVFQDGYPGTHATFPTAMTHELGHGIGWRHSNAHYQSTTGADQPCDSSVEECSNSAIMYYLALSNLGTTLQTWDIDAAQSVYPGGTCGTTWNDLNGDGRPDILWRHLGNGQDYVWFMNGAAQIGGGSLPTVTDLNWRIVGMADFDGDGKADIVWRHYGTGQNYIWYMNGMVQRATAFLPALTDVNWEIVGIADFNGDGKPDILWRNRASGANSIWVMNNTTLTSTVSLPAITDLNWRIEGAADMNGDGSPDIVWRNFSTGQNYLWIMSGTAYWSAQFINPSITDPNWTIEAIADLDGDGSNDLVWRNYATGENYVWFMNRTVQRVGAVLPTIADVNWKISGPR